jgi:hypothetical protein
MLTKPGLAPGDPMVSRLRDMPDRRSSELATTCVIGWTDRETGPAPSGYSTAQVNAARECGRKESS